MLTAKIMLLGDMGVGKTSVAQRLVFKKFDGNYKTTMGVEILTHDVVWMSHNQQQTVRLVLWDTDGDFGSKIFDTFYVSGSSGAIIISDASRPRTVSGMLALIEAFETRFPGRPYKVLINKIDLIEGGANAFPLNHVHRDDVVFVSAKTGEGIEAAVVNLADAVLRRAS
jgi:Ras-related protein Rab-5C